MAPVLGIPVLNRGDLLTSCLRSIDYPVQLVVIDNSGTGELADIGLAFGAAISEPVTNLGFTASVNHIVRSFPNEPEWWIANADTEFAPGDLARLAAEPGGWVGINDWRVFRLTAETVERVGLWDESFFNYCSDADYERRCDLAGVDRHFIPGATTHVGSVVIRSEARYGEANQEAYPIERDYYRRKWGGELRGGERYATPFDRGGSVADWNMELAATRAWHRRSR